MPKEGKNIFLKNIVHHVQSILTEIYQKKI